MQYLLQESKLWRCNSSVAPKQTELGRAEQDVEVVTSPHAFTNLVVIEQSLCRGITKSVSELIGNRW